MLKKFLLIIVTTLMFFGCGKKEEKIAQSERFLFGTLIKVMVYADTEKVAKEAMEKAFDEIKRIDNTYNSKDMNSQIFTLNNSENKEIIVDEEGKYLFEKVTYIHNLSKGKYDITISPLMNVWGFGELEKEELPTEKEIKAALTKVDFSKVKIDDKKIKITDSQIEVDTGSFLKGYAIQRAKEVLEQNGIKRAFITAVSSIDTIGTKPGDAPWRIGLQNPENPQEMLGIVELNNQSMGVSGDYQTYVEINGKKYHHILDKDTGYPVADKKMVAVICRDSFMADMYSTAFYSMKTEEVIEYADSKEDLEVLIVDSEGNIVKSRKFVIALKK
ncbi:MAG: FAD:protein FMN transferase [Cetobacterium sp.]